MKKLLATSIFMLLLWGCNEEPAPPTLHHRWGLIALQYNDDDPITTGLDNFELILYENNTFILTDLNGITQVGRWEQVDDTLIIQDEYGLQQREFLIESLSRRDLVLKSEGVDQNGDPLITTYYLIIL